MFLKKIRKKLSDIVYGEERWIDRNGNFRQRAARGLVPRSQYCYGMLRAADQAKYFGIGKVKVLEFGVASGAGLLNMIRLAELIQEETGVEFDIVGFDACDGLPAVKGYRDHAELWVDGDFSMKDRAGLLDRIDGRARIIFGDISDTIEGFTAELSSDLPIGFISVDVDIYTATVSAFRCLTSSPENYLPATGMYFDDTMFYFANKWAGELLAINEFNAESKMRKIDKDRSLFRAQSRHHEAWYSAMYVLHILDHPIRNYGVTRASLDLEKHYKLMRSNFLL